MVGSNDFPESENTLGGCFFDFNGEFTNSINAFSHKVDIDFCHVFFELMKNHIDVGLISQFDHDFEFLGFDVERVREIAEEVFEFSLDDQGLFFGQNGNILQSNELDLGFGREESDEARSDTLAEASNGVSIFEEIQKFDNDSDS